MAEATCIDHKIKKESNTKFEMTPLVLVESNDSSVEEIGAKEIGVEDTSCLNSSKGNIDILIDNHDVPEGYEPVSGKKVSGIGWVGSMAIAVNYLVGPAMLDLPATYQKAGFIPTTAAILLISLLSIFCSLNFANVVSKIPDNKDFTKQIEYSDTFNIYWGRRWFIFTHIAFFLCVLCSNIASIIDTSQVVDEFIVNFIFQESYAIRFYPFPVTVVTWDKTLCPPLEEGSCEPFNVEEDGVLLLSLGFVISAVCFLPMALMDLKENTQFQIFGFIVTLAVSFQFICVFFNQGFNMENLSLWGESWSDLVGIILFNYTFTTAVPAWLCEKSPNVDVPEILHKASWLSSALYILVGCFGALSIPNVSTNMLSSMIIGDFGGSTQIGASIFAFFIIGLGIPLFCVLMRMNLMGSGLCNRRTGNILAVYVPWGVAWFFYKGSAVSKLLSWGGIFFTSVVAFIAPLLLALYTSSFDKIGCDGSVSVWACFTLSKKQEKMCLYFLLSIAGILVTFSITEVILETVMIHNS